MQLLIDRLQRSEPPGSPDSAESLWLTPAGLDNLVGHVMDTQVIDLSEPVERQINEILAHDTSRWHVTGNSSAW